MHERLVLDGFVCDQIRVPHAQILLSILSLFRYSAAISPYLQFCFHMAIPRCVIMNDVFSYHPFRSLISAAITYTSCTN